MINLLADALDALDPALAPADAWTVGTRFFADCGSEWITMASTVPGAHGGPVFRTSVPGALMDAYLDQNLSSDDPWMQHSLSDPNVRGLRVRCVLSGAQRDAEWKLCSVFEGFGTRHVMLVPTRWGARIGALVLYANDDGADEFFASHEGRTRIRLLTAVFNSRYRPENDDSKEVGLYDFRQRLSPREIETLKWLASGLGTDQIAWRMRVQPVSVTKNFASIRRKLGTATREQSLVVAIRMGIIDA